MATKQELFDVLLVLHIDMGPYLDEEAGGILDNYFKVLVHMLGLESELAAFLHAPREDVERSAKRAYDKYRAEEAAYEKKARAAARKVLGNPGERKFGIPLSEEERARRHTELYGAGSSLPPKGTGHHSMNLNRVATSAVVGVATGGVVYGLAKWKEEWFKKNIRLAPRYLAIILGASTFGLSYRRRLF